MTSMIIGLFDTPAQAEQARSEIMALNIPSIDVQVYDKAGFQLTGGTDTSTKGFFDSFSQTLGFGPSNQAMYQEGVRRGGTVVSVRADDSQIDEIADTLNRSGAVDIDTRAAEWQVGSWKAKETKSELRSSESMDRPAVKDDVMVDKLEVRRGNVWVYRHASDDDQEYRRHWSTAYGGSGLTYEQYGPAYRFGTGLSGNDWATLEPEARRTWEEKNPGTWEKVKDAVRYSWDRGKGKSKRKAA
jgi:hypothetical protein